MKILCLGDSYTIGESLPESENFPNQLKALLLADNVAVNSENMELTVIAKTGDTTFELMEKIDAQNLQNNYNLVTLLIGVNNQYRNLLVSDYAQDFEKLLLQAIGFAGGLAKNVIVLSIPDWGLTPFNTARDAQQTSLEIDAYNNTNAAITKKHDCAYINITEGTRIHAQDTHFLATDLLHYSKHEYALWAQEIFNIVG